jgi:hypothetical protein
MSLAKAQHYNKDTGAIGNAVRGQSSTIPLCHIFLHRFHIHYIKWIVTTVGGKSTGRIQLENKLKMYKKNYFLAT